MPREEILDKLNDADAPALLMSLIHLTGDFMLLDGPFKPMTLYPGQQFERRLSPTDEAEIRRRVALELEKWFAAPGHAVVPTDEQLGGMMRLFAGTQIDADYIPMMREELAIDGADSRALHWTRHPDPNGLSEYPVLVIGAGVSGLLAAKRLKDAGFPYLLVERNPSVGGTWYENNYPGCRVDVGNHFYAYSFEPSHRWSSYYSERDELLNYLNGFADRYGLRENIAFETSVVAVTYDRGEAMWTAVLRTAEGSTTTRKFRAVLSAVGQFNQPTYPEIRGRDLFGGVSVHTARWDRSLTLTGKRVAVIGTGASAFQLVPAVADQVASMVVFQRSPPWMKANPRYHDKVSERTRWVLEHVPFYAQWYRFLLLWHLGDSMLPSLMVEPGWHDLPRTVNPASARIRELLTAQINAQVYDDPELLAKVVPDYAPGGKRMLQDNGSWLKALQRPNVELIAAKVTAVDKTGVTDATGRHHEVDVIVYATGFKTLDLLGTVDVIGGDGLSLRELWGSTPRAHLGMTIPGFPNFFAFYGPGTNLQHGGSIIFVAECQVRYALECLRELVETGDHAIEISRSAYEAYANKYSEAAGRMLTALPEIGNYFKNDRNEVITNWPWRLLDMWRWTLKPDFEEFKIS